MLTLDSQRQYEEMGVNVTCGGIEVARTEERMEELRRRMSSAKNWDMEAHLVTPAEIKELVPFINEEILLGGCYFPTVSAVDSLRAGTIFREKAMGWGRCRPWPTPRSSASRRIEDGVRAVVTDQGRVEAEYVVIACGVWSPRIARMAGATIPLTPAVHQMIDVGPIPILQESGKELAFPIVRDMDTFMYERQTPGSMEVGSYAHRPIFHSPTRSPPSPRHGSPRPSSLSPTTTSTPSWKDALELCPTSSPAEIKYAINGLLSLTPDAMPLIGETVEVPESLVGGRDLDQGRAGDGAGGGGVDDHGYPELDPHAPTSPASTPMPGPSTTFGPVAPSISTRRTGSSIPGSSGPRSGTRGSLRSTPAPPAGRRLFRGRRLGAPHWYESNAALVDQYGIEDRPHEWDRRWWSPIQNAEHLAMREKVGLVDLAPFVIFDFTGPGVVDYIQRMTVNNADVAVGRSVYTPLLTGSGGFKADLTVLRLAEEHFRVITGAFDGPRDKHWFGIHLPEDGSVHMSDSTSAYTTIGVWGPEARNLVSSITDHDLSNDAFPTARPRRSTSARSTLASSGSPMSATWAGRSMCPPNSGGRCGTGCGKPARTSGSWRLAPGCTGPRASGEGLPADGVELESEYNPVEAGLAGPG